MLAFLLVVLDLDDDALTFFFFLIFSCSSSSEEDDCSDSSSSDSDSSSSEDESDDDEYNASRAAAATELEYFLFFLGAIDISFVWLYVNVLCLVVCYHSARPILKSPPMNAYRYINQTKPNQTKPRPTYTSIGDTPMLL